MKWEASGIDKEGEWRREGKDILKGGEGEFRREGRAFRRE